MKERGLRARVWIPDEPRGGWWHEVVGPGLALDASCTGTGCRFRVRVDGADLHDVTLAQGEQRMMMGFLLAVKAM